MTVRFHVHLYGDLHTVLCHICALHRALGDALPSCDDRRPDGDCSHVQIRECHCSPTPACDACQTDFEEVA